MLRRLISPKNVTFQEVRRLTLPAVLTILALGVLLLYFCVYSSAAPLRTIAFVMGLLGLGYGICVSFVVVPTPQQLLRWKWAAVLSHSVLVGLAPIMAPPEMDYIVQIIMILVAAVTVILWDRRTTFVFLLITIAFHLLSFHWMTRETLPLLMGHTGLAILAFVIVEVIHRLTESTHNRIQRLESLNEFSRKIAYSLETDELVTLVGAALQNAIKADTYLLGLVHDDALIDFDLIFDDGEFFPAAKVPLGETLSGWVIRNHRSLFIPDVHTEDELVGADLVLVGTERTNRSWIGVPMQAGHINGVIAVGSYKANNFDRTDLELLENLGQQAALALDNALHHAEVEAQSHLDSLTGVYNHGYLLEILSRETAPEHIDHAPLSLIMLDIDYFKHYNDNYGHLVGDQVLTLLTEAIRTHIDSNDAIGRWGGEEFAIVLPNTTGQQALYVAERIRQTMSRLSLQGRDGKHLPVPTVSQGIAVFPQETDDVDNLVDLADQRLYLAKERGRDQIEPDAKHWQCLK